MITLIAACSRNRVIGKDNQLIWHLPEDLKRFKELTTGKTVLMGRKTFESIGRPLPKRTNIIVTSDKNYKAEGCVVYNDLSEALKHDKDIMVIGGSQIYQQCLDLAHDIQLTIIDQDFEGDAFFPELGSNYQLFSSESHQNEDYKWQYNRYLNMKMHVAIPLSRK